MTRFLTVALGFLVALPALLHAQETRMPALPYIGRPIADVAILVENAPSADETVLGAVQTRRGQPLAMADVRETITHLFSLGRFEDVQVEADSAPDGSVQLTYRL